MVASSSILSSLSYGILLTFRMRFFPLQFLFGPCLIFLFPLIMLKITFFNIERDLACIVYKYLDFFFKRNKLYGKLYYNITMHQYIGRFLSSCTSSRKGGWKTFFWSLATFLNSRKRRRSSSWKLIGTLCSLFTNRIANDKRYLLLDQKAKTLYVGHTLGELDIKKNKIEETRIET